MSRLSRLASAVLAAVLFLGLTTPARASTAADVRQKQASIKAKRASAAAKLNALKASDSQLEKAVQALVDQTKAQAARVSAARQALGTAEGAVAQADAQIASTEAQMTALRSTVVDRAVQTFVRPDERALAGLTAVKDLGEASRRYALLAQVANNDRDVLDQLRAQREDLGIAQQKAASARAVAAKRRKVVTDQLNGLTKALAEKARMQKALDARVQEVQGEVDALAAQDASVTALIRRQSAARASRGGDIGNDGGRVSGAGLIWPVPGASMTSGFGYRWGRLHAGIDLAAPTGTPIHAAKSGDVIFAGWMDGYGNAVIIDHGGGLSTLYGHQSRLGTSEGQRVSQGETIGYVGSTGHSTGPHCHFETRIDGTPENPLRYLP